LNIAQNGYYRVFFGSNATHSVNVFTMGSMIPMREVDPGDVHAIADHLPNSIFIPRGRADGGDNFGAFAMNTVDGHATNPFVGWVWLRSEPMY
jgi:hypothetical protein